MAILKAFKGLRPPKEIARDLASRPYDVLNSEEARKEAYGNKYSLLHIIKPEIDLPEDIDLYAPEVYKKAKENRVKEVAKLWMGKVEDKVFDALHNLEMTEKGWLTKEESAFKFYETGEVEIPEYYQENLHLVCDERVEGLEDDYD